LPAFSTMSDWKGAESAGMAREAMVGSYFSNIDGQSPIKTKRSY
jgi:hypothetical protein